MALEQPNLESLAYEVVSKPVNLRFYRGRPTFAGRMLKIMRQVSRDKAARFLMPSKEDAAVMSKSARSVKIGQEKAFSAYMSEEEEKWVVYVWWRQETPTADS